MSGDRRIRLAAARRRDGFTLIELLLGIALSAIFALALYGFFFAGVDSSRGHESQAIAQADARTALDRLATDIRQAISPDDGLTAPVISLSPTSIELYVDPSRSDAATSPRPWKVRYSIVGSNLIREATAPIGATAPFSYGPYGQPEVLISTMTNGTTPLFSAITTQGASLGSSVSGPQARDIAQISIDLLVGQKTQSATTTLELQTDVSLRNAIRL